MAGKPEPDPAELFDPVEDDKKRHQRIIAALSFHAPRCPKCGTGVMRSRSRGFFEHLLKELTSRRPHRCGKCRWRGWRRPVSLDEIKNQDL